MNYLSSALVPRFLIVLLAVLLVLLVVLFLLHSHVGGMPTLVQSTEGILD